MHTAEAGLEPYGEAAGILVERGGQGYRAVRGFDNGSGVHR